MKNRTSVSILSLVLLGAALIASLATFSSAQKSHRPIVTSHPLPSYSPIAVSKKEKGKVLIDVKIDSEGKAVSAVAVTGPSRLRKLAREKSLEWRFNRAGDANACKLGKLVSIWSMQK